MSRSLAAASAPAALSQTVGPVLRPEVAGLCDGLPIADVLPDVLRSLRDRPSLVLQADPGAGKTTIVPLALLADEPLWLPATGKIVVRLESLDECCSLLCAGRAQMDEVRHHCIQVGSMRLHIRAP